MVTLYDFPESGNSWKIRLLLHILDIPHKVVKMDGLSGATRNQEFKKKNVDQRLPLLELEDGSFLSESNAILHYLAKGTDLSSDEPAEEAQILRWMFFEQCRIEATIAVVRFCKHYSPEEKRLKEFEGELQRRGTDALQVMDDHMAGNDFFVGNRFTIADIALYAYTHVAGEADVDLSQFPNIQSWIKRIEATPRYIPFDTR